MSRVVQDAHPSIPWKAMAGMRHKLVHDYRFIRLGIVWKAAIEEVPDVLPRIAAIIPKPPSDPNQVELGEG